MADVINFGPNRPKKKKKSNEPNPIRILLALGFLLLISFSLIPFFLVYGLMYVFLPKAVREDSKVFLGIANSYLMDFLKSIESGKRIFSDPNN